MILGHCRLAISKVNHYIRRANCRRLGDEMDSVALEAVVVAVNHIANGRMAEHGNVGGYITEYVHKAMSECMRKSGVIDAPVGKNAYIPLPLIEDVTLAQGFLRDDYNFIDMADELRACTVTKEEAQVLELKKRRYTDVEISARLGISRLAVHRIRRKLKTRFEKREKRNV